MRFWTILMMFSTLLLSACSAQYSYHHDNCDIAIDSLRDLPQGAKVTVSNNCTLEVEVGELRNGSSEAIKALDLVSGIVKEIK